MAEEAEVKEQKKPAEANGWQIIDFDAFKNPPVWLAAAVYVLAGLLALAVLFLVAVGLFGTFQIAYETVVGELKDRVEAAKVFFPILLALVGGPLPIWRVVTAHVQAAAARHQADVAQEGFYTSLFTKAVEQLGTTREVKTYEKIKGTKKREAVTATEHNLEVRLGAIYALDRVARDSERDHWPIMQVLCAYIRNPQNCGAPVSRPDGTEVGSKEYDAWRKSIKPPRVDVQAALTVVGQRLECRRVLEAESKLTLDLSNANLQRAVLESGYFERAIFDGTHLDRAWLYKAQLADASFNRAHLSGASFDAARLHSVLFDGADLAGASFNDAHLENASFFMANLVGVQFFNTDLSQVIFVALASTFGDASTKLDDETKRPASWPARGLSLAERLTWVQTHTAPFYS